LLHAATRNDHPFCVAALLGMGADHRLLDNLGRTARECAASDRMRAVFDGIFPP